MKEYSKENINFEHADACVYDIFHMMARLGINPPVKREHRQRNGLIMPLTWKNNFLRSIYVSTWLVTRDS